MGKEQLSLWQILKISQSHGDVELNLIEKILAVFTISILFILIIFEKGARIATIVIILEIILIRVLFGLQTRSGSKIFTLVHCANVIICFSVMYYYNASLLGSVALIGGVYVLATKPILAWFKIQI
tara:strand:+ start:198 stop:575 length:378 start_codon:yes stop_codon:yes gene_type:complete